MTDTSAISSAGLSNMTKFPPTSQKLGRNYRITVIKPDGTVLQFGPPFTLELDITRNILSSQGVCKLRVYNLGVNQRTLLFFNQQNLGIGSQAQIILQAGYGDLQSNNFGAVGYQSLLEQSDSSVSAIPLPNVNLPTIFTGNITYCYSAREGQNFITQIECFTGGTAAVTGNVDVSFPKGTPWRTVLSTLMSPQYLPFVTPGAIGDFPGVLQMDKHFSGNTKQILDEITGGAFFVDNNVGYILRTNEYAPNLPVVIINDNSGILNSPILEDTTVRLDMIFEPTVNIGSLAQVDSSTNPLINGLYAIQSCKHRGTISEVVSGDLITSVTLNYGMKLDPATAVARTNQNA